jgi:hypothetical protein
LFVINEKATDKRNGLYLWLTMIWQVGGGFNEIKKKRHISGFSLGISGKK